MRVQVAFQGGGARTAALVAAAQALAEAEKDGLIEVTRVAGTSAGSIAAVLFSSRKKPANPQPSWRVDALESVRAQLKSRGDSHFRKLFPPRGMLRQFLAAFRGRPLYDDAELRKLLGEHVDPELTLGNLDPPTLVTVVDAGTGKKHMLQGETMAIDAMLDSSGLPFVFRTAKSLRHNQRLDGGLGENLPTEDLLRESTRYGDVVAISFTDGKSTLPEGPSDLALRILELAIDNSVQRSIRDVGEESVCRIKTKLTTIGFDQICSAGFEDDPYGRVKLEVRQWIEEWAERYSKRQRRIVRELPVHEYQNRVHTICEVLRTPVDIVSSSMIVIASGLGDPTKLDEVFNSRTIRPRGEPLRCWESGLATSAISVSDGVWHVTGDGQEWDCFSLPSRDLRVGDDYRSSALFFKKPLSPDKDYTIIWKSLMDDAFSSLREGKPDYLLEENTTGVVIQRSDLVLLVPKGFALRDITFGADESTCVQLDAKEIAATCHGYADRETHRAYAWRAVQLKPGKAFKVSFSAAPA